MTSSRLTGLRTGRCRDADGVVGGRARPIVESVLLADVFGEGGAAFVVFRVFFLAVAGFFAAAFGFGCAFVLAGFGLADFCFVVTFFFAVTFFFEVTFVDFFLATGFFLAGAFLATFFAATFLGAFVAVVFFLATGFFVAVFFDTLVFAFATVFTSCRVRIEVGAELLRYEAA